MWISSGHTFSAPCGSIRHHFDVVVVDLCTSAIFLFYLQTSRDGVTCLDINNQKKNELNSVQHSFSKALAESLGKVKSTDAFEFLLWPWAVASGRQERLEGFPSTLVASRSKLVHLHKRENKYVGKEGPSVAFGPSR